MYPEGEAVREIDVESGSSGAGTGLGRFAELAKLGCPFVELGYVRVDSKFRSAED
jgi:hypothetical protein